MNSLHISDPSCKHCLFTPKNRFFGDPLHAGCKARKARRRNYGYASSPFELFALQSSIFAPNEDMQ